MIGGALALCPLAAALAPANPGAAIDRAQSLAAFERRLGLRVVPGVHAWLTARPIVATLAQLFYVWVHLPAAMGALVWVRLERPHAFRRARDTFVVAQLMTVVVTLCLPVAPPRMLPDLGFRGLLAATYGSGGEALAHSLQSLLAAMPSGHIVFAAFRGGVVAALARPWWARAAAIVYPLLVVAVVMATGNHLWVDAAAGLVVLSMAFAVVRTADERRARPRRRQRVDATRRAARAGAAAPGPSLSPRA